MTKRDSAVSWWGGRHSTQCSELMLVILVQVVRCLIKYGINISVLQVDLPQDKTTTEINFTCYPNHGPDQLANRPHGLRLSPQCLTSFPLPYISSFVFFQKPHCSCPCFLISDQVAIRWLLLFSPAL